MIASWIPLAMLFVVTVISLLMALVWSSLFADTSKKYAQLLGDHRWAMHIIGAMQKESQPERPPE